MAPELRLDRRIGDVTRVGETESTLTEIGIPVLVIGDRVLATRVLRTRVGRVLLDQRLPVLRVGLDFLEDLSSLDTIGFRALPLGSDVEQDVRDLARLRSRVLRLLILVELLLRLFGRHFDALSDIVIEPLSLLTQLELCHQLGFGQTLILEVLLVLSWLVLTALELERLEIGVDLLGIDLDLLGGGFLRDLCVLHETLHHLLLQRRLLGRALLGRRLPIGNALLDGGVVERVEFGLRDLLRPHCSNATRRNGWLLSRARARIGAATGCNEERESGEQDNERSGFTHTRNVSRKLVRTHATGKLCPDGRFRTQPDHSIG